MSTTGLSLAGTPAAKPLGYISWTFGQAARDPYYIMVVIYIFYPFFSNAVVGDPVRGQALIGYITAATGFVLAVAAPLLGAIADKDGRRKPWILTTVLIVAAGAFSLWFVGHDRLDPGLTVTIAILFCVNVSFAVSEVFHNAMLPSIAPVNRVGMISGLAFALGNVGGVVLMLLVLIAFALPGTQDWAFLPDTPWFGIDQSLHEDDRIVGPIAGAWILLMSLPLLLFTPDGQRSASSLWSLAREGTQEVMQTIRHVRHYANIAKYLVARMFFIDGMVGVMTFGGVYASGTFAWDTTTMLIFGLCTSTAAMFGAYLGGLLDDRVGSMRALLISIGTSSVLLLLLVSIQPDSVLFVIPMSTAPVWDSPYFATAPELVYFFTNQLFAMFFVTGLSASRTLMARISPPEMATQFFGLFALSGTVTAFLAPLLVATTTDLFDSQRMGFASLTLLMILGVALLFQVREEQATAAPRT